MVSKLRVWLFLPAILSTTIDAWKLVWSDEFDGNGVDLSKWVFENGDGCSQNLCGWGNSELQWYQSENTRVYNGKLIITAKEEMVGRKNYTSSKLITKGRGDWKYGKIKIRARLPEGRGIWPAIWMLPTDSRPGSWPRAGEMDIVELVGNDPSTVHMTMHYGEAWNNKGQKYIKYTLPNGKKFSKDFHTFTLEWKKDEIKGFIDGQHKLTVTTDMVNADGGFWYPFNEYRFHLILNVAVGGTWPGSPDRSTRFPQQMEVDYVRVYQ